MNKEKPTRIVITNIVSLNPGDSAILSGMFKIFKFKYGDNCEFIVFDKASEISSKLYPWANFRQSLFFTENSGVIFRYLSKSRYGHWNLRLRYIKLCTIAFLIRYRLVFLSKLIFKKYDVDSVYYYCHSDLIVSTGGTYLVENYGLWPAIYDYRLSIKTKTPLIFFTQSLGPYQNIKNQQQFKYIFSRSEAIFLRDQRSKDNLLAIGVPDKLIKLSKDAAFALKQPPQPHTHKMPGEPFKIAISVRSLKFFDNGSGDIWDDYVACIQHVATFATRELHAEITFLSTCQGISGYWTDDSTTAAEICQSLPLDIKNKITIDTFFRQPKDVIQAYTNYDLVIATRMHAAILGIQAHTPVIGIAYEFKTEELFTQLGMQELLMPIQNLNPEKLEEMVNNIFKNTSKWKQYITLQSQKCSKEALSVLDYLPGSVGSDSFDSI